MRTVLITGGSRGIGRAAAWAFAREGFAVAVNYLSNGEAALSLMREMRENGVVCGAYACDVADYETVSEMCKHISDELGSIHILINNAGNSLPALFSDMQPAQWRRTIDVHLEGTMNVSHCVLPEMLRRHNGIILNVSSMWGQVGAACEVDYSAAKAGIIGFTKALAKEVAPNGVRVNCVAPGAIDTDMNRHLSDADRAALCAETPLGRFGTPEEVASVLTFLASPAAGFITGQVISPNGGLVV